MSAKIQYYGVRGSTPVCGKDYLKFGGATTCVAIDCNDHTLIIDAGTGIRQLGFDLLQRPELKSGMHVSIFFTHTHWDHIQGFPFFIPIYIPQNKFDIYGESKAIPINHETKNPKIWTIEDTLELQQNFMYFPVATKDLASSINYHTIKPENVYNLYDIEIKTMELKHPNSSMAYRFNFGKSSFVFATDVEHNDEIVAKLINFAEGADVLAYDCQYWPDEYLKSKIGWGHSTYEYGSKIALAAGVKKLHMIHHDPLHNDADLEKLEKAAQSKFKETIAIPEGFQFTL